MIGVVGSPGRRKYACSEWVLPLSTVRPAATSAWPATWPPKMRWRRSSGLRPRNRFTSSCSRSRMSMSCSSARDMRALLASQARLGQPLLEERDAIVAPELLAAEDEQRHAEDVVARRLLLARLERRGALAAEVGEERGRRAPDLLDHAGHRVRLVDLERPLEEAGVHAIG